MKRAHFFTLIILFFSTTLLKAQFQLHLKIINSPDATVLYRLPIGGTYVRENTFRDSLDAQGSIQLNLPLEQPCFIEITDNSEDFQE